MNVKNSLNITDKRKKVWLSIGVKSSVVYALSSLFSKGLAIITIPIFTRIMSTSEIGIVNLYTSWYSMISVIATLSLTSGGFQLALKEFRNERDAYTSSVLTLTSSMALIIGFVYVLNPPFWNKITGLSSVLILLLILELLLEPARSFWLARQRYEYKYRLAALVTFSSAFIASLVSVIVVIVASKRGCSKLGEIRLLGNYSVMLAYALGIWLYIYSKGKTIYNGKFWRFSLSLSIPLIGYSISAQILNVSDRTMISHMVDNSSVGIYSVLYTASSVSLLVWQAVNASFVPFLYENMENNEARKSIRDLSAKLLGGFALVAFLMTVFAPEIVRVLATKEYYDAVYIMPPIAAGVFMISVSNMYSNILIYYKKTKFIMFSSIIAAVINVVLNYFGIRSFGYVAAAYTTLVSYVVLAAIQGVIATKIQNIVKQNETQSAYNNKYVFLLSSMAIILCMVCLLLYRFDVVRFLILVIAIVCAITNRGKIKELVRSVS